MTRARNGDKQAWDALVERHASLVWSICRRHRLGRADSEDVSQNVWPRLTDQLDPLREPVAIAGWLATTTAQECARVHRVTRRPAVARLPDAGNLPDRHSGTAEEELLAAERHAALRHAFTALPPCCQRLLTLLSDRRCQAQAED